MLQFQNMFNDILNVYLLKSQRNFLLRIDFNIIHQIIDKVFLELRIYVGEFDVFFLDTTSQSFIFHG